MILRPFFAKLLAPSALFFFLCMSGGVYSGCGIYYEGSTTCDEHGENCVICDGFSCRPADPSVNQGGNGSGGEGTSGGAGSAGGQVPCDPNVTTCGCMTNNDCPANTLCLEGLCIVGCNNSFECGAGKVCVNGKCEVGCSAQNPCQAGFVCQKGYCIPNGSDPQCKDSSQCQASQVCVMGICKLGCAKNSDCPLGEVCDGTTGSCISDPSPTPSCGPSNPCPGAAQCGADGYCHYVCTDLTECKLVDSRFFACDQGICKTQEEVNPECTLQKPCPPGQDCVSNKCL